VVKVVKKYANNAIHGTAGYVDMALVKIAKKTMFWENGTIVLLVQRVNIQIQK